ncbi:MAG: ATP-binding cassette domain-containing protein [Pseudomonadota bacterium]
MAGNFLLTVRDLAVEFDGEPTFYCPEFDVRTGDKVLLTGASGAGKSVFLKVLAGSLPASSVRSGHFIVGASQSMDYAEFARRRPLGDRTSFVFQDAMNSLHPYLPISRQLKVLGDFDTAGALQTMGFRQEKLDLLGKRIFRRPLSGGERQRLSLLFAAVPSRDFVLLDEPLTDIDIFSRREIEKLIDRDLLGAVAKTVILVTHDTEWLQPNVDRKQLRQFEIIALEDGACGMSGAPAPLMLERRRKQISVRQPWSLAGADPQRAPWDKGPNNGAILALSVRDKITVTRDGSTFAAWPFQTLDDGSEAISIRRGEGIALYGLSGCGKSVLLQCIAGLWSRKFSPT